MSPAVRALVGLFVLALVIDAALGLNPDGVALLGFRYSVLIDPLGVLDGWDYGDSNPCRWTGVVCSDVAGGFEPRVVGLVLPESQLLGSIPDQLGSITHLRHLDLSLNLLNGTLPSSVLNASELRILSLAGNELSGGIPADLGGLRQLLYVNLSDNAFVGPIPAGFATLPALRILALSNNYFSGEIPVGFGMGSQSLETLDLSGNLLSGTLPSEIGTVQYLNISSNRLSGSIPPEIGLTIPANATLDLSYNNFSGTVPELGPFLNQKARCFSGNPGLCGGPLRSPCTVPATISHSPNVMTTTPSPAIAAIPETLPQQPVGYASPRQEGQRKKAATHKRKGGLAPTTIAGIVVGDLALLSLACMFFIYHYQTKRKQVKATAALAVISGDEKKKGDARKWLCVGAGGKQSNNESVSDSLSSVSEQEDESLDDKPGQFVTVDGESLELHRLLKASAYVLGASGSGIVYKAVLEDGTTFAVRRIGECLLYRMKDFENRVRLVSKLRHPNLAHLRAFYWSPNEKLLIYDFAPNGSLAGFTHSRKMGSGLTHMKWEVRLRIARGLARGLAYVHEKKFVHGNLKPSNVLLGLNMDPRIGDFGLEQLTYGKTATNDSSSGVYFNRSKRSTLSHDSRLLHETPPLGSPQGLRTKYISPYQAPEALRTLRPTRKWDVYSFGSIFLELIMGRPVTETEISLWEDGAVLEERNRALRMVDPAIRSEVEENEEVLLFCLPLGFACIDPLPSRRPTMKEVVQVLERIPTVSSFLNSSSFSSSSSYH